MFTVAAFFWVVPTLFAIFAAAFAVVGWHPAGTKSARWAAAGFAFASFGSIVDTQRHYLPSLFEALATPSHWATVYCLLSAMLMRHGLRFPRIALGLWALASVAVHAWLVAFVEGYQGRILLMNISVPLLIALALPGLWRARKQAIDKAFLMLMSATMATYPARIALFFAQDQVREVSGTFGWSQYLIIFYLVIAVLGILCALAIMLATGMDIVAKHHAESSVDPLTRVANRRAFDRWFEQDTSGERSYGAVIMIDLDKFKLVNDRHGHAAGDAVLKAVAIELQAKLVGLADVARIGGEEFAALVHAPNAGAAAMLAMAVREAIAAIRLPSPLDRLTLTASVGVAMRDSAGDLREVLHRADMAVYQAKAGGRNLAMRADVKGGLCTMSKVA